MMNLCVKNYKIIGDLLIGALQVSKLNVPKTVIIFLSISLNRGFGIRIRPMFVGKLFHNEKSGL